MDDEYTGAGGDADADFGYEGERDDAHEGGIQPPAPVELPALPYGQADRMMLNKVESGLGQVKADFAAGKISPGTFNETAGKLMATYGPLRAAAEKAQAEQQQSATAAALGQTAMQDATTFARRQHDADNFLPTMRTFIDPTNNGSAHFYQTEPGKWAQVDMGGGEPPADAGGAVAASPDEPNDPGQPGEADLPVGDQSPGPQKHTMTIINGPYAQKAEFENGQLVRQTPMTFSDGRPVPARTAQEADNWGLTPDRLRMIDRQAAVQAMHMPPGRSRDALISHVRQRLIGAAIQQDFATKRQAAQADVAAKAEAGKEKRAADAEAGKAKRDSLTSATSRVHEQYMAAVSAHAKDATQAIPEEIATPQARVALARQLHMEHWAAQHPDDPDVKKWLGEQSDSLGKVLGDGPKSVKHIDAKGNEVTTPQRGPKNKPAAAPAAANVEPLPPEAMTLEEAEALKANRVAGKAGQGRPRPPVEPYVPPMYGVGEGNAGF